MKKITSSLFFIAIIFSACNKTLDMTPNGRTTLDSVFSSNIYTGAYLNSVYGYIQRYGTVYYWLTMQAGVTDEAHDNDDPSEGGLMTNQWNNGVLSTTNNPMWDINSGSSFNYNMYGNYWSGIRKANVFLENIDKATVDNPLNRARWKAEAKVLRAFYFFELIKAYGALPIIDKTLPVNFDYTSLTRPSFDSCVKFIVKDCSDAIAEPNLPYRITQTNESHRFTKAIAYMIRSEALLFNASPLWNANSDISKWKSAADSAKTALTDLLANGYALTNNWRNYFLNTSDVNTNPSDKETIFEISYPNAQWMDGIHYLHGIPSNSAMKAGCSPSQELVDSYDMQATGEPAITGYNDADHLQPVINSASGYDESNLYKGRDPRFYATVFYNGAYYGKINGKDYWIQSYVGGKDGISSASRQFTHNGYYFKKFVDSSLGPNDRGGCRWKKYRLSELYLNYAEAENEAYGPTSDVYSSINIIRNRVGMPNLPSGLTQSQMRERIHRERRVELAYEESRFWDVRRWKILSQTDVLTTGMKWTLNSNGLLTGQRFVVDRRNAYADKFLIWPIPATEISSMPKVAQSPGW